MTMQRGEVELMQAVFEQDSLMTSSSDHYSQVKRESLEEHLDVGIET